MGAAGVVATGALVGGLAAIVLEGAVVVGITIPGMLV